MTVLDEILETKREEVARLRAERGEQALLDAARGADPPRGFHRALRSGEGPRIIAEVKRASPSRGTLREGVDAAALARTYAEAGAAAISVLTDEPHFRGTLADLEAARGAVDRPVLRKDFVIDPLQLLEARAAGADAGLLIVAALDDGALRELLSVCGEHGLDALVEVHTRAELDRALDADAQIIGINNRNLRTFETDVAVTRTLLPHTNGRTVISESGLGDATTLRSLEASGVHAFLIGEALMTAPDPGEALRKLREGA